MLKKISIYLSLLTLPAFATCEDIEAMELPAVETLAAVQIKAKPADFKSFTGRVAKGKVRLRTTPTIDGFIVQELQKGDLLLIDGEQDGFYQVKSPDKVRGYVFRTFVLDGKVEGSRVNVRLAPDLEAPVIAQLNSGDAVNGQIFSNNSKWIECCPPEAVRFYVASEYLEQAGDEHYLALCEERKSESAQLLSGAIQSISREFSKPFDEMDVEPILSVCQSIVNDYADCHEVATRAKELMSQVNSEILSKRISHLEGRAKEADILASKLQEISPSLHEIDPKSGISPFPLKLTSWQDIEQGYFAAFKQIKANATEDDFYRFEKEKAITLSGVLTPYLRPVKNKPGDYLLLDPNDNHPLAYLYSTQINLQEQLGNVVQITAAPRPNNHFAYPAYYVLSVEKR